MDYFKQIKIVRKEPLQNSSDTIKLKSPEELHIHPLTPSRWWIVLLTLLCISIGGAAVWAYQLFSAPPEDILAIAPAGYALELSVSPRYFFANTPHITQFLSGSPALSEQTYIIIQNIFKAARFDIATAYPSIFQGNFYVFEYPDHSWAVVFTQNPQNNAEFEHDLADVQTALKSDFLLSTHPYRQTNINELSSLATDNMLLSYASVNNFFIVANGDATLRAFINNNNN
ncbi:hypothetical protein M1534_03305 [Patescibacteria group bacterium]|jgi:hypothetical protein|nr:hypothetical protein [Patescibacteria group bacterium]